MFVLGQLFSYCDLISCCVCVCAMKKFHDLVIHECVLLRALYGGT